MNSNLKKTLQFFKNGGIVSSIFVGLILLLEVIFSVLAKPNFVDQTYYKNFYVWPLNEVQFYKNHWAGAIQTSSAFGVVRNTELPFVNNYGFVNPDKFPYKRAHEKEIVIGVFGASVAEQFYQDFQQVIDQIPVLKKTA